MADLEKTLNELREEYSKTKHNKATNKHLGILRKKIANIRKEMASSKKGKGIGFAVRKTGDATAVLVGFPNAGKSSLLGAVTNAESRVAAYAFTTLEVIPGIMQHMGANIQILDVPGLIEGAGEGKGSGAKIASVIRVSDLLLIMLDITKPEGLYMLLDELYELDIRVNKARPRINVERHITGGLEIESLGHKVPGKKDVQEVLNSYGIYNGKVIFHQDVVIDLEKGEISRLLMTPWKGIKGDAPSLLKKKSILYKSVKNVGDVVLVSSPSGLKEETASREEINDLSR